MTDTETNAAQRRHWNDAYWSSAWLKREPLADAVTDVLLGHLELASGERVLDIGCGGGNTTIAAGRLVGLAGAAVGVDISEPLVKLARERAGEQQLTQVSFHHADAQSDAVPGAPFDVAMSRFGVMFFDDPVTAFANIRGQTVPGGRLGFICWQAATLNPWFIGQAVAPFVPPPPTPAPGESQGGPFSLSDPARVAQILGAAGWRTVGRAAHEMITTVDRDAIVDDGQLRFMGVPAASLDAARAAVDARLAPLLGADGRVDAPLAVQVFTARA